MGKELKMQPSLLLLPTEKDVVYTPYELASDMVSFFQPSGICLDPCSGDGVFYDLLPSGREWCEIERGRDFYAWTKKVDWIIGNPPFSNLLSWVRHSFLVASDIVYLMPLYRMFSSESFFVDLFSWGGIRHIRRYKTGSYWGFPFGQSCVAVHYQADYKGATDWSNYD